MCEAFPLFQPESLYPTLPFSLSVWASLFLLPPPPPSALSDLLQPPPRVSLAAEAVTAGETGAAGEWGAARAAGLDWGIRVQAE